MCWDTCARVSLSLDQFESPAGLPRLPPICSVLERITLFVFRFEISFQVVPPR
jgi:hypothetical protein